MLFKCKLEVRVYRWDLFSHIPFEYKTTDEADPAKPITKSNTTPKVDKQSITSAVAKRIMNIYSISRV